jgi:type IX secretion system PorP/SprF family membrane protein
MKNIKIIIFSLLIFIELKALAQDPSFSQFYFNQTYFNPAFAGIHGGTNASITYRRQWVNMPGKFETMFFSFDSDISNIRGLGGIGFTAFRDMEGEGFLTTTGGSMQLNTLIPITRYSFLKFGAEVAIYNKTVDWSNYIFGDQLDPIDEFIRKPTSFTYPSDQDVIFPDLTVGVLYMFGEGPKRNLLRRNWSGKIGFAFHHINKPNQSFLGQNSRLPIKLVTHANMNFALNREADIVFSPCAVFEWQETAQAEYYGMKTIYGGFNFLWDKFFVGNWVRFMENRDAYIINIGFIGGSDAPRSDKFKIYYSYDITISDLNGRSTGGSHEISFAYFFYDSFNTWFNLGKRKRTIKRIPCPEPNVKSF